MRHWLLGFLFLLVALGAHGCSSGEPVGGVPKAPGSDGLKGNITISGAWALYPMAMTWTEEFRKANPGVTIDVSAGGAGKGMADVLSDAVDLGMVSREINAAELEKGAWPIAVVKDAVVPTVSASNPVLKNLLERGLSREELMGIFVEAKTTNWGILGPGIDQPMHVYTRSDACGAAETWAKYLGGNQENLKGTGVYGDPGEAEAVRGDPLAIGFNNINYAYDVKTKQLVPGLNVAPLDVNGNHTIDPEEQVYASLDTLTAAIADGRYPSPPARDLYFVSHGQPKSKEAIAFLRWVLTDGQAHVLKAGYVQLAADKLSKELGRLPAQQP